MDNDHLKAMEKEGYVETPDAEFPKTSIRKSSRLQSKKNLSSRLQSKKNLSSCSKYAFKSYHGNSKYTMKSSKASLQRENSSFESKIQEEKNHQFPHRKEINGVFSADIATMKSSTVIPSFKYHVRAKDGIHLVVDLNLKRSDWLKSMEKAVCVCQNHSKPAFESFRKEIECLGNRNNLNFSMNSYVQNNFSLKSMSREIGKTLPCWSKVDQSSEVAFSSEEIQFSDISSQQKGSVCSRTGKISSENLLNRTIEVNQEAGSNHRRSTIRNEERINSAEGMEVSGREENAFMTSASDDGPKKKKRYYKSDVIRGQSHERILRSTKIFGGKILECDGVVIRRSTRLHSK